MPKPPPLPSRPTFWPEDRRSLFAKGYEVECDSRWPLIQDPERFHNLPGDRPFRKRQYYNERFPMTLIWDKMDSVSDQVVWLGGLDAAADEALLEESNISTLL